MEKFCTNCGNKLDENSDFCVKCGKKVNETETEMEKDNNTNKKKKKMPTWAIVLIVIVSIGILGVILSRGEENKDNDNDNINETTNKTETTKYEVNKPFEFDNLEITIGNEISFVKVDNQFSEHDGKDVVKVPITVKNKKDKSHNLNMFYLKIFGSKGTELDSITAYFMEDDVDFAGELMPEASYTKYLHFLYDGDGVYTIKFDNYSKEIEFKLNIKK